MRTVLYRSFPRLQAAIYSTYTLLAIGVGVAAYVLLRYHVDPVVLFQLPDYATGPVRDAWSGISIFGGIIAGFFAWGAIIGLHLKATGEK